MLYVVDIDFIIQLINDLRESIWGYDIPSPTVPEYIEHHEQMQELLKQVDDILDELDSVTFVIEED